MNKEEIYIKIIDCLKAYDPKKIGIFGSFARNESKADSDIDILVDFNKTVTLFDLVGMELELSEALGIKVDLITERSVNPLLKEYIERDLQIIYQ